MRQILSLRVMNNKDRNTPIGLRIAISVQAPVVSLVEPLQGASRLPFITVTR